MAKGREDYMESLFSALAEASQVKTKSSNVKVTKCAKDYFIIDVAGFNKDNLNITMEGKILTIKGTNQELGLIIDQQFIIPDGVIDVKVNILDGIMYIKLYNDEKIVTLSVE